MTHDMDTVACPRCGGNTARGMVIIHGCCGICLKAARKEEA